MGGEEITKNELLERRIFLKCLSNIASAFSSQFVRTFPVIAHSEYQDLVRLCFYSPLSRRQCILLHPLAIRCSLRVILSFLHIVRNSSDFVAITAFPICAASLGPRSLLPIRIRPSLRTQWKVLYVQTVLDTTKNVKTVVPVLWLYSQVKCVSRYEVHRNW